MSSSGISNNISNTSISQYTYGFNQGEKLNDEAKQTDETKNNNVEESNNEKNFSDNTKKNNNEKELTEEELKEVTSLKKRDAEVKAHEQAHVAAGGQYAGSASFEYQTGPDGVRYAVGGEVPIDVSEIPDDPEATATKMDIVQKAALAPINPSSADRAIASSASMKEIEARAEIANGAIEDQQKKRAYTSGDNDFSKQEEKGSNLDLKI